MSTPKQYFQGVLQGVLPVLRGLRRGLVELPLLQLRPEEFPCRQALGILDVAGRVADPALRLVEGLAQPVVEALDVEDDLPAVVAAHQPGPADIAVQGRHHPEGGPGLRSPARAPCRSAPG